MEIVTYPEFQRDDFAVVVQPTLVNTKFPLASDGYTDLTYLSSDCFHFSQKNNARCKFTKNFLKKLSIDTMIFTLWNVRSLSCLLRYVGPLETLNFCYVAL